MTHIVTCKSKGLYELLHSISKRMITHKSSSSSFSCRSLRTIEYEDRNNRKSCKLAKPVEYSTKRGVPTGMHMSSCEHLVALVQPDAEK